MKREKGISLIALIIILLIILIIGVVTFMIINNKRDKADNVNVIEGTATISQIQTVQNSNQKNEIVTKDAKGWYQKSERSFTNGKTIVELGDYINYNCYPGTTAITYKGYSTPDSKEAGEKIKWRVLGVENGNLLVVMEAPFNRLRLYGQEGYTIGISELNNISEIYGHGENAVSARSINVDDINKIIAFDPTNDTNDDVDKYGNKVIYYVDANNDNKISFRSEVISGTSDKTAFFKLGKKESISGTEEVTIECNEYYYSISGIEDANELLCKPMLTYWLASQFVGTRNGYVAWGLRYVDPSGVHYDDLCDSMGYEDFGNKFVRPVVLLSTNIQLIRDNTSSNAWNFKS